VTKQLGAFKHVVSGIDILFGLLPMLARPISVRLLEDGKAPYRIGLSLRPYPPNVGFDLEALDATLCAQIVEYIHTLSEKVDRPVVVVPLIFSDGDGARNDRAIISRIESALEGYEFEWSSLDVRHCQNAGFGDMLNEYCENMSGLDLVVGERFHSLVLSQILVVPYIAISYDKKIGELVKAVEMEPYSLDLLTHLNDKSICMQLMLKTEKALSNRHELVKKMAANNDLLNEQSKENQSRVFGALG
jgi:polysaccharide pyruvyl transferase WcaK-like protein